MAGREIIFQLLNVPEKHAAVVLPVKPDILVFWIGDIADYFIVLFGQQRDQKDEADNIF